MIDDLGWRCSICVRNDSLSQDAFHDAGRLEEHRRPRLDHGFAEGIPGDDSICQGKQASTGGLPRPAK